MAANPLIACDPATSWYGFTYSLSWSNECEVAEVLSDIPFISVGVLVFAISALFLVVKRVSLSAVWLSFSALLSFVAAVLDLGTTLADGIAINTTFIASGGTIRAREVLLALSIGLRLLFYWSYVAEPPRKDLSAVSTQTAKKISFLTLECTHEPHSGSWMRWGLPGKSLGVGLLVAIITTTVLQIVWRVVPQFHQYNNVYGTDAALELLVSFLLLLKLLSNTLTLNSPDKTLAHTFRECLAPMSGLLVNIAIGVGGLLCFAFTESTVGRLLQAFEIYIIAIFVVVTAFLRHRDILLSATSSQGEKRGDVVFTLPEPTRGSTFRITPPLVETPRMSMILGTAIQNKASSREVLRRSARRSLNHVSSWVSSKFSRNRAHYEDEEVRLWNAEKAKVDPPYTGNIDMELARSSVSSTQEPKELGELLRDASASPNYTSIISALDARSALVRSMEGSIHSGQSFHPSRVDVLQCTIPPQVRTTSIPVSSVPSPIPSGVKHAGSMAATAEASPVYGLPGIQSVASASDSRTSLDELLRQQNRLDRSIETLKLFSTRTSANSLHSNSATSPRSVELSRSPSTGQRTVSSEVSLSNFPIPPWLTTPVPSLPSSRPTSVKRIRGSRRARLAAARPTPVQDAFASVTPMSSASLADIPRFNGIPHSPLGEENESLSAEAEGSSRSDSEGMQYNVTSFIGGLATPGEPGQGSQEKPRWPRESEPNVEATQVSPGVKKLPPRVLSMPRRLDGLPASPAAAKLSPLARSSILSRGNVVNAPLDAVQYRGNNQTSPALPVALSAHTPVTEHAEQSVAIPPTGPQLVRETDSPVTVLAKGADGAQRTFVRPRPPPLVIQPYTELNPGIPRVHVLADD